MECSNRPIASIVITTRNRVEDALCAVASCFVQDWPALEFLVFDDASEDGTAEKVRAAFPRARVIANRERAGLIVNRSRGLREARGEYVFSLDDDAYYSRRDIVSSIVAQFEADTTIGAIALPYIEPLDRLSRSSLARPFEASPGQELRSYVGCAHAVRRDVGLALGGYRDLFEHQGEERDFCLRLRAAGWRIVYGTCGHVVHKVNPHRDTIRMTFFGIRNQILFEWFNTPLPNVLWRIPSVSTRMIAYKFTWSSLPIKLKALGAGLVAAVRNIDLRRPVRRSVYASHMRLPTHGPEVWVGEVPPPCHVSGAR